MGKKKRDNKHGPQHQKKKSGVQLPPATGKLYWTDGYWTDSRWGPNTPPEVVQQIHEDWNNFEWVKQTAWYKEKLANNLLEKH